MSQTVLITGASNGIGKACARVFARKGYDLVLVARHREKLEAVKAELSEYDVNIKVVAMDLTGEDAAVDLYNNLVLDDISIDILVNNAGFGDRGAFHDSSWEKQKKMVLLNIMALMQMTYVFGQSMKLRKKGRILNVASIAGLCAGPYMSTYYATKAFVLSFSESIAYELKDYNVEVSCLCPGPTKTGFMDVANLGQSPMFKLFKPQSAEAVAEIGIQGLFDNRLVQFTGLSGHLLNLAARLLPRSFLNSCTGFVNGKRKV